MKKFLIVLAAVALFAVSSFASVISVTKEMSEANYPGVLAPGSLTGTNVFISDLTLLPNTVILELLPGGIYTAGAFLKTDMGTMGLMVNPVPSLLPALKGITVGLPTNVVDLSFANGTDFGTLGLGLMYGVDSTGYTKKNLQYATTTDDSNTSSIDQYIGLRLGLGNKGMDLGLGLTLRNEGDYTKMNYQNTNARLESERNVANAIFGIDLDGRMSLGNEYLFEGKLAYVTGSDYTTYKHTPDTAGAAVDVNTATTISNGDFNFEARLGKDIKATKSLTIKMAAGLTGNFSGLQTTLTEDKIAGTKTYNTTSNAFYDINIPFNLAIEAKLNDTWSVNAGSSIPFVVMHNNTDKTSDDNTKNSFKDATTDGYFNLDPVATFAFGVTGVIGDLTMDLYMNPELLTTGPNFISGGTLSGGLNYGVALSYNWK
jgi:hypothetical protein